MAATTIPPTAVVKLKFPKTPSTPDVPRLESGERSSLPDSIVKMFVDTATRIDDMDDIVVLHYNDNNLRETYLRLVQFAKDVEYVPLTKRGTETYPRPSVSRGGTTLHIYDPRKHANNATYRSTDSTFEFFKEEVKLFVISTKSGYKSLQSRSTKNILYEYPIYVRELVYVLNAMHESQIKCLRDIDEKLAMVMCERAVLLDKELKVDAGYKTLIHEIYKPRARLAIALRGMDDTVVEQLLDNVSAVVSEDYGVLIAEFLDGHYTQQYRDALANGGDLLDGTAASQGFVAGAADHSAVFAAIEERRVVICGMSGTAGPRKNKPNDSGNRGFHFQRGELLIIISNPLMATHVKSETLLVENRTGEIGEVFDNGHFKPFKDVLALMLPDSKEEVDKQDGLRVRGAAAEVPQHRYSGSQEGQRRRSAYTGENHGRASEGHGVKRSGDEGSREREPKRRGTE